MSVDERDSALPACCGCGTTAYKAARWFYLALFVVSTALSWLLRHYAADVLQWTYIDKECRDVTAAGTLTEDEVRDDCYGKQAVLRLGFATFLFFAAHFVLTFVVKLFSAGEPAPVQVAHAGLAPCRAFIWVALLIVMLMTAPASVYEGFFQFARVAAAIYLLIQLVILLDSGFRLNALFLRDECNCQIITLTAVLFSAGFAGIVLLYIHFAPEASCSRNIFFITFTLILSVGTTALSVSSIRTDSAGLLTAMFLFVYGVYLCAAALLSAPPDRCTDVPQGGTLDWLTGIGVVFTLATLVVSSFSTAHSHKSLIGTGDDAVSADENLDELPYNAPFFHFTFASAACFMVMVLTGWSLQSAPGHFNVDVGEGSMWVKVALQWVSYALYTWILIAPRLFPSRSFV